MDENQFLLSENIIMYNGEKTNVDSIRKLLPQKANTKLLGIPLKLLLHQGANPNAGDDFDQWLLRKPKRLSRMKSIWSQKQIDQMRAYKMRFQEWKTRNGEPPSLVDSVLYNNYANNIQTYLSNNGFFKATVDVEEILENQKRKRKNLVYHIQTDLPYTLDTISTQIQSPVIDSLYREIQKGSLIKRGDTFNTLAFEAERNRLYRHFRNSGVYDFQLNSIDYEVLWDTTGTDFLLPTKINIETPQPNNQTIGSLSSHSIKKINKVTVYTSDGSKEILVPDYEQSTSFDGLEFFSENKLRYSPKILAEAIGLRPGDVYSDEARDKSLRQLNRLQVFEYPTINYSYSDSLQKNLNASIILHPKERFGLEFGADLTQSNIQDQGIAFNSGLSVLNIFEGAEKLQLSARGTIGRSGDQVISELGGDISLNIPRIFAPNMFSKLIPVDQKPSTALSLGTAIQNNIGLDKQTFSANLSYRWEPNDYKRIDFKLIDFAFINNQNVENYYNIYNNAFSELNQLALNISGTSDFFDSNALDIPLGVESFVDFVLSGNSEIASNSSEYRLVQRIDERKNRLTQNNLILGSSFDFVYNTQTDYFDENFSQIRFKIETVGNLLHLLSPSLNLEEQGDSYLLFDLPYTQYIKGEFDYIRHWLLGDASVLAFRSFIGLALPLGNSTSIPFSRSYFSGGANDNRAWEVYRLGPGSSNTGNEFNEANFKLALNLEYRFDVIGALKGALFTDVGNIWNLGDDVTDSKRKFEGVNDLEELAVGSGIGLRYDFGLFLFRLDTGFKTHNPALPKPDRWFTDFKLRKANFTIGINYPF
ncbi:MAG: BamA/TamA family outer membrane protein [Flavobacteriaceae bacterium]|nr:BamA/TamA family outer membrane protein [Flavobacteriaceae bacterium]